MPNPVAISPHEVETIRASWVTAKTLAAPDRSGGAAMSAVSLFFDPGQGHARHNHPDSEQIIFLIAGEAEMMIEFTEGQPETRIMRAGDLAHIPRGAFHSTFNVGWEPVRILAVYSPPGPESAMLVSPEFEIVPVPRS